MSVQAMSQFQKRLKFLMNEYVHFVYKITGKFPKEELFSSVSQFRRATMSVILNYIEGFSRIREKVQLNLFETSYGSLNESKYLLEFCFDEKWIEKIEYDLGEKLTDEIGAMLWSEIQKVRLTVKGNNS
ncbi:four helix bundle protein [Patescibacteria group bacterium]|nr:four helix bundle protein [Patescibacteria group bacterium]